MDLTDEIFRLFINRSDCYAIQTSRGYVRVDDPLTPEEVAAHLRRREDDWSIPVKP